MFRIIASDGMDGAFVEKGSEKGKLYYSWGPNVISVIREEDLQVSDEGDMEESIKEGAILHTPPLKSSISRIGRPLRPPTKLA